MIRFNNVSFAYTDVPVLENLSFSCGDAEVVWLSGANGSGKTTIIKLALSLVKPLSGTVDTPSPTSAVFQEDRLCDHLTAVANIRLGLGRRASNQEILAQLSQAGVSPKDAVRPVSQLSGGQRRRVCLTRALGRDSALLCLDEPYTGIDDASLDDIIDYTLARIGRRPVLLVCHDAAVAARFSPIEVRI